MSICKACRGPVVGRGSLTAHYCMPCLVSRLNPQERSVRKRQSVYAKLAHQFVEAAIRYGDLPPLSDGKTACRDCGGRAVNYDHRDYRRPLAVTPVCRACNEKRGPAIHRKAA